MTFHNTADTASAIADLQEKWPTLLDLDRARAVHKTHQAGASFRTLARALNCSASLLRHLNLAAQAPPLEQVLARQGRISIRELARRAKDNLALRADKEHKALERQRMQACQDVCRSICDWLAQERLFKSDGELIINDSRRQLADAEASGQLPPHPPAPLGSSMETIIERLRPPRPVDDGIVPLAWYAAWLMRWVYFALPDSLSRHQALGLALKNQIEG